MAVAIIGVALGGAVIPAVAATKQAHGKGRLLAPVLVFFTPAKGNKKSQTAYYHVYFRTAAGIAGPGHMPGSIRVDDVADDDSELLSALGAGSPSGRCYRWTLMTTPKYSPKLTRKKVGDTVAVRLRLYDTDLQVRRARLRDWTSRSNGDPGVKKAIRKIGCPAG